MQSIFLPMRTLLVLLVLSAFAAIVLAQAPNVGAPYPATSEVSDQKAGSILIYNFYTSSSSNANLTNTRINITNTNSTMSVAVHLFFVDGSLYELVGLIDRLAQAGDHVGEWLNVRCCPRLGQSCGLATAKVHDLTLVTRNTHHVRRVGVRVLNPFEPRG